MSLGHYLILIVFAYLSVMIAAFFGAYYGVGQVLGVGIMLPEEDSEDEGQEE